MIASCRHRRPLPIAPARSTACPGPAPTLPGLRALQSRPLVGRSPRSRTQDASSRGRWWPARSRARLPCPARVPARRARHRPLSRPFPGHGIGPPSVARGGSGPLGVARADRCAVDGSSRRRSGPAIGRSCPALPGPRLEARLVQSRQQVGPALIGPHKGRPRAGWAPSTEPRTGPVVLGSWLRPETASTESGRSLVSTDRDPCRAGNRRGRPASGMAGGSSARPEHRSGRPGALARVRPQRSRPRPGARRGEAPGAPAGRTVSCGAIRPVSGRHPSPGPAVAPPLRGRSGLRYPRGPPRRSGPPDAERRAARVPVLAPTPAPISRPVRLRRQGGPRAERRSDRGRPRRDAPAGSWSRWPRCSPAAAFGSAPGPLRVGFDRPSAAPRPVPLTDPSSTHPCRRARARALLLRAIFSSATARCVPGAAGAVPSTPARALLARSDRPATVSPACAGPGPGRLPSGVGSASRSRPRGACPIEER